MSNHSNHGHCKNLLSQASAIYHRSNERSFGTRARYFEAEKRFCEFLADKFRLEKLSNVSSKHFTAYVEHLVASGKSANTIQSDLSGIRYFHEKSGSKNRLPDNSKLNLPKREVGKLNRGWLDDEIYRCYNEAARMGRIDVMIAIDYALKFGLRESEICKMRVEYLKTALRDGQLVVTGKGGQTRVIKLDNEQCNLIKQHLEVARKQGRDNGDYLISKTERNGVKKKIRSLQNWMSHNRHKFMNPDRIKMIEEGQKDRLNTIYWHGLRHTYAQKLMKKMEAEKPENAKKIVSENLGHHRPEITNIYLAKKINGRRKK